MIHPRSDSYVAGHPYCLPKGIDAAYGAARYERNGADVIVVPMRRITTDELTGLQFIYADGRKRNLGNVGVLLLGSDLDKSLPVYIVEGWADGVSTWRLFGNVLVVVVFGNKARQTKAGLYFEKQGRDVTLVLDGIKK